MFYQLIIPDVAVGSKDISNKPKGLPNAIAVEPTFTLSESPLKGGVKLYTSILFWRMKEQICSISLLEYNFLSKKKGFITKVV